MPLSSWWLLISLGTTAHTSHRRKNRAKTLRRLKFYARVEGPRDTRQESENSGDAPQCEFPYLALTLPLSQR